MKRRRVRIARPVTNTKRGVIPGPRQLPLAEYERLYGQAQTYKRYLNGVVTFVIEGSGDVRFVSCEGTGPVHPPPPTPPNSFARIDAGIDAN